MVDLRHVFSLLLALSPPFFFNLPSGFRGGRVCPDLARPGLETRRFAPISPHCSAHL
ncbi:hypothetical protein Ga0080559_TMP3316 [Salipiger profundus]|uniref:Uncharacterized protein n=1 Tax=Salipiger profundus TaxID=1229727 RepID=A0A1U7D7M5_9RHOB|nr:hypothetical protein Ga0080559_TMP3316 [Salipiger profundus]